MSDDVNGFAAFWLKSNHYIQVVSPTSMRKTM